MTSSFCELFTQQPQSPPIHPRHQANEDERMSPPSKKNNNQFWSRHAKRNGSAGASS
jgi:hypothetical protein